MADRLVFLFSVEKICVGQGAVSCIRDIEYILYIILFAVMFEKHSNPISGDKLGQERAKEFA